ncbi:NAD-dependent DNA ligase [Pseudomonas sp. FW306-02-F02-AA]|uniref:NAD-dependent DNA ligase n=1 Tax=Pseudomonas fluorescens TaxID=294 RepID=A0A0N9VWT6_PSEFL|nr:MULTISPECIES: BRCT domain-containing protein [Pseudomonas]ALI03177.1 NAD-dependent DNA ligase [Pseudomonas fluorescens]PMZ00772.1 NAD-dependent DNA ligase [Pseudomonas sp. FW306-02-F02-AB]PMZ06625.1 NAD-dependent DNA ligase [Pseudomonas sp. FW306-02-H06C]PMZ12554.1 NAD-dependent DNA ligase [Pseudomonas sp. FW306-02-F02-AA]PMZ18434.1 NAD-dependent DNA ligase [Pseudomonas sp. FW306-02-F08-AA]
MVDLHQEFQNSALFHEARIDRRSADALVGIAAGLAADGKINLQEAEFLKSWIENHLSHLSDPVVNLLYKRLASMLSDGVLDAEESAELLEMLHQFAGLPVGSAQTFTTPTSLPLNNPPPVLSWADKVFIFSGVMAYGPRKDCESLILERGGLIGGSVNKKVHYLVVGSIGNDQWLHSSYGTKIKKAVELRESGVPIAIVSEEHWQKVLFA